MNILKFGSITDNIVYFGVSWHVWFANNNIIILYIVHWQHLCCIYISLYFAWIYVTLIPNSYCEKSMQTKRCRCPTQTPLYLAIATWVFCGKFYTFLSFLYGLKTRFLNQFKDDYKLWWRFCHFFKLNRHFVRFHTTRGQLGQVTLTNCFGANY